MAERHVAGWSRAQRRLHWWTAGLVTVAFGLGWIMVSVPLEELLTKFLLFQLHKTLGLVILALVIWRLGMRVWRGRPATESELRIWEQRAARLGQAALYGLLLVVPAFGYLTACTAPAGVPTFFLGMIPVPAILAPDPVRYAVLRVLHRWAAIVLVTLATGHALAALRHHRHGMNVLVRMWRE